jgi:hypothetical protein
MVGHSDPPDINKLVIKNIIDGLESSKDAISEVQKQLTVLDKTLALQCLSHDEMKKSVDHLIKIIRDGNGKASLLDRVNTLENEQKTTLAYIQENKSIKKEASQGIWQTKTAMISGVLALAGVLITALVNNWPF